MMDAGSLATYRVNNKLFGSLVGYDWLEQGRVPVCRAGGPELKHPCSEWQAPNRRAQVNVVSTCTLMPSCLPLPANAGPDRGT